MDEQLARALRCDPLSQIVGLDDVRGWWETVALVRMRSVVDRLMTVTIKTVGNGRRIHNLEACAPTVDIMWKTTADA